jgi:hypothetical protein
MERAVLIRSAEEHIDASDLVADEPEKLGVAEVLSVSRRYVVENEGFVAADKDFFDNVRPDVSTIRPASFEVRAFVYCIVVWAGEAEIVRENRFGSRTIL